MAKRTRRPSRVNLRTAYKSGGYSGSYAWFVRNKVVPIIGEAALQSIASVKGSRVKEYSVTKRNLQRVFKALGLSEDNLRRLSNIEKAVSKAGPSMTASVILDLVEKTSQPTPCKKYPINLRIPLHPISHNMLYNCRGGRFVKSSRYIKWRKKFFPMIQAILPNPPSTFSVSKPVEIHLRFGHIEKTGDNSYFDLQNFGKAIIDVCFEHLGGSDHTICNVVMERELVDDFESGFMEIKLRNI